MQRLSLSRVSYSLIMMTLLLGPLPNAAAQAQSANSLIKGSGSTVYFHGDNGKRYVFPSEAVYKSWYQDYSQVTQLSDAQLAAIPLGGNVTFKPGSTLVKITTDPRVYAVSRYGLLHWISSEAVASQLYGADWNKRVMDVPDSFFVNYAVSYPIGAAVEYDSAHEMAVHIEDNVIRPSDFTPPVLPPTVPTAQTNPATLSVSLSASTAVQNQTVSIFATIQNSNLPIASISIYKQSQNAPLATCPNSNSCSYMFTVDAAPLHEVFYAVAFDSASTKITTPESGQRTLNVGAASDQVQLSATPQNTIVGSRVSFTSISTNKQYLVSSHKIYALIPNQTVPVLWKDCGAVTECSGSTPFYRTTALYAQTTEGGQSFISPSIMITAVGSNPPKPTLTISSQTTGQATVTLHAPSGETILETIIKDGRAMTDPTLAICNQSTCTFTLQINVPGSITAFTSVGGKYEQSNTITVTP